MKRAIGFVTLQRRCRGAAWTSLLAAAASAALTAVVMKLPLQDYWLQVGQVLGAAG
jgi:hypothetical protein